MELCFQGASAPTVLRSRRNRLSIAASPRARHGRTIMCAPAPRDRSALLRTPEAVAALFVAGVALLFDAVRGVGDRNVRARLSARAADIARSRALSDKLRAASDEEIFLTSAIEAEEEKIEDAKRFVAAAERRAVAAERAIKSAGTDASTQDLLRQIEDNKAKLVRLQEVLAQHTVDENALRLSTEQMQSENMHIQKETADIRVQFESRMQQLEQRQAKLAGHATHDDEDAMRAMTARNEREIFTAIAAAEEAKIAQTDVARALEERALVLAERAKAAEKARATLEKCEQRIAELRETLENAMEREASPPIPKPDAKESKTKLKRLKKEMRAGEALAKTLVDSARDVVKRVEDGQVVDPEQTAEGLTKELEKAEHRMRKAQQRAVSAERSEKENAVKETLEASEREGTREIRSLNLDAIGNIGAIEIESEDSDVVEELGETESEDEFGLLSDAEDDDSDGLDFDSSEEVVLEEAGLEQSAGFSVTSSPVWPSDFVSEALVSGAEDFEIAELGATQYSGMQSSNPVLSEEVRIEEPSLEQFTDFKSADADFLHDAEAIRLEDLQLEQIAEDSPMGKSSAQSAEELDVRNNEAPNVKHVESKTKSPDGKLVTDNPVKPDDAAVKAAIVEPVHQKSGKIKGTNTKTVEVKQEEIGEVEVAKISDAEPQPKNRGRGRPKKSDTENRAAASAAMEPAKRGRGRPRKVDSASAASGSAKKIRRTKSKTSASKDASGNEKPKRKRGRPRKTDSTE